MADPFFYETTFLLPLNGVDGATTWPNEAVPWSVTAAPLSVYGSAHFISTAQSKWGGSSLRMGGGTKSSSYVLYDVNAFGTYDWRSKGGWSAEAWVRFDSIGSRIQPVFGGIGGDGNGFWGVYTQTDGRLTYSADSSDRITQSTTTLVANQWYHIAVCLSDGVTRLFIDGVSVGESTAVMTSYRIPRLYMGSYSLSSSVNNLLGYLQDFRLTAGAGRYAENFTPPTAPFDTSTLPVPAVSNAVAQAIKVAGADAPGPSLRAVSNVPRGLDMYYGGLGRIVGTVKENGTPANIPLKRRVRLFRERDGHLVRETWSDPITGNYSFESIDATVKYTVVSYDYTQTYRAVIGDNLTPDPMP